MPRSWPKAARHQSSPSRLPRPATVSRRRLLAGAGALSGAAILGSRPTLARQATPVSTGVGDRDWRAERWVGTWATAPHVPGPGFEDVFPSQIFEFANQTVRQIARVSLGGDHVRVRLANTFGDEPLVIGAAHVALRNADARIEPGTDRPVTFSGLPSISIPPGALALSDPVALTLPPLGEVAISIFLPEPTTSTTVHGFAFQTNYFSPKGNFAAEIAMPVDATAQTWVFLTGVDVMVSAPTGVVVAFGDSLTDGAFSTPDTNQRWPDILAERFAADAEHPPLAVVNEGIGGNRLLRNPPAGFEFAGENALARFDRDVLAQPGVTHVVVFEGINDIGMPILANDPAEAVRAEEMIAALQQLADRAHEHGIVAIGATITPFEGAMYFSIAGEAIRQTVNNWIRAGGAFDAVLDFDAVVRDPEHPTQVLSAFDGGDRLHFNDAGFKALADSIDLALFRP